MNLEYKQVYAYLDGDDEGYKFTTHMGLSIQQLGAEGWDLVSTVPITPKGRLEGVVYTFKREMS